MKSVIFIRGVATPYKTTTRSALVAVINPDVNTVRGMAFIEDATIQSLDAKKAHLRTLKNRLRLIATYHQEEFLVICDEFIRYSHMKSLHDLCKTLFPEVNFSCIDIKSEKFFDSEMEQKILLQEQKKADFIFHFPKYIECSETDQASIKRCSDVIREMVDVHERAS